MRKLTILVATLLMIASVASAQITAGPVGPFAMVDADGHLMGGAVPQDFWLVALNTPAGSGFVKVSPSTSQGPLDTIVGTHAIFFTSTDCTGQAYTTQARTEEPINGGAKLAVNSTTLYTVQEPLSNITIGSMRDGYGLCQAGSGSGLYFPVTEIGDISNTFTPPFRIVTAASLTASVPMLDRMSHWLLAAALIGAFVLYDRRRMVRLGLS